MKIIFLLLCALLQVLLVSGCWRQQDALKVELKNNAISVVWHGEDRLAGSVPVLDSVNLNAKKCSVEEFKGDTEFSFHSFNESSPVLIRVQHHPDANAVGFYLSPNGNESLNGDDFLGLLIKEFPDFEQGISSYLFGDWEAWTKPVLVKNPHQIQKEKVQFFLWRYKDGAYAAAIPLGGKGYSATFGRSSDAFAVKSYSYKDSTQQENIPLMALAFDTDPYRLLENVYSTGMKMMGLKGALRKNKTYPPIFENIGWCTWNALGADVNGEKLLAAVESFAQNDFKVPFLLIDDGWLQVSSKRKLKNFEADRNKFPNGFKPVVQKLKNNFGVEHVGVWHTMNGYWAGVAPNSNLGKNSENNLFEFKDKYNVHHAELADDTFFMPSPVEKKGNEFYENWYTHLTSEGISFVKVDQQAVIKRAAKGQLNFGEQHLPFWHIAQNLQANLQDAVAEHLGGNIINCQNMAAESYYNYKSSAIARNSDDFFPTRTAYFSLEVEKGNAAAHVLANVHNALWFSQLVWPDYDMFQSHHVDGEFHAISRAISGGPIYITDEPGKQNFDILRKLVYSDGAAIRTDIPARPTEDCLFQLDEAKPFKAFSMAGNAGVLAAWNAVDADLVSGSFEPAEVYGLEGEHFVVYSHFNGLIKIAEKNERIPLHLDRMGYDYFCVVPIVSDIAVIGLVDKYNSPKSILSQKVENKKLTVTLREGGEFAAYLKHAPQRIRVNEMQSSDFKYESSTGLLTVDLSLEINSKPVLIEIEL
jgi:raffinose synthase